MFPARKNLAELSKYVKGDSKEEEEEEEEEEEGKEEEEEKIEEEKDKKGREGGKIKWKRNNVPHLKNSNKET